MIFFLHNHFLEHNSLVFYQLISVMWLSLYQQHSLFFFFGLAETVATHVCPFLGHIYTSLMCPGFLLSLLYNSHFGIYLHHHSRGFLCLFRMGSSVSMLHVFLFFVNFGKIQFLRPSWDSLWEKVKFLSSGIWKYSLLHASIWLIIQLGIVVWAKIIFFSILEVLLQWLMVSVLLEIQSRFDFLFIVGDLSEKAMAPHSSTLAWKIPRAEEPGRLQSMGLLRVRHDWSNLAAAAGDLFLFF